MCISRLPHPFATACEHGNLPVVKLFLLLGVHADLKVMEHRKSPLEVLKDNTELCQILSEDMPFVYRQYPEELAKIMKGKLEESIRNRAYIDTLKYGMQGLRITDCSFVYTREFQDSPVMRQAFVYRMLMSSRQRNAIARKIERGCGRKCIPAVLQRAQAGDSPRCREKMQKIIDSAELLSESYVCSLVNSTLSAEEQISFLRKILENQDVIRDSRTLQKIKEKLYDDLFDSYLGFSKREF